MTYKDRDQFNCLLGEKYMIKITHNNLTFTRRL